MNQTDDSQFNRIDLNTEEYTKRFNEASDFEKIAVVKAEEAKEQELVITLVHSKNGMLEETRKSAKKGDFIVTNPSGERYVVSREKFFTLYEMLPGGMFKSTGTVKAIRINKNVEFIAPWGEKMRILSGGYLVDNKGERYGIEEKVFTSTYNPKIIKT